MRILDAYPVIVTPRVAECRDFVWLDIVEQIEPAPGFWDPYVRG